MLHPQHPKPALSAGDGCLVDADFLSQGGVVLTLLRLPLVKLLKEHALNVCQTGIKRQARFIASLLIPMPIRAWSLVETRATFDHDQG